MKQIMTISAALLFLTIGEVQAQNGIEQVLKNIETKNNELQAKRIITCLILLFLTHIYGERKITAKQSANWLFHKALISLVYMLHATS